jgi:hypothetical protein
MTISLLRLRALQLHLAEVVTLPRPSPEFKTLDEWLVFFQSRSKQQEPALLAALALADDLEARFGADALPETEAAIRADLAQREERTRQAAESTKAARQAVDAALEAAQNQSAALAARRKEFIKRWGLTPEAAAVMGWDRQELEGLFDPASEPHFPVDQEAEGLGQVS